MKIFGLSVLLRHHNERSELRWRSCAAWEGLKRTTNHCSQPSAKNIKPEAHSVRISGVFILIKTFLLQLVPPLILKLCCLASSGNEIGICSSDCLLDAIRAERGPRISLKCTNTTWNTFQGFSLHMKKWSQRCPEAAENVWQEKLLSNSVTHKDKDWQALERLCRCPLRCWKLQMNTFAERFRAQPKGWRRPAAWTWRTPTDQEAQKRTFPLTLTLAYVGWTSTSIREVSMCLRDKDKETVLHVFLSSAFHSDVYKYLFQSFLTTSFGWTAEKYL